ncbi:MAG: hypothetical protein COA78_26155 [Blastopirellula sp.]|nr:MAG: hypothetical protein COA78_26155 [Blastopirellula sp.]
MNINRKHKNSLVIQIGHTELRGVSTDLSDPSRPAVECVETTWRKETDSIYSETGKAELTVAFKEIIKEFHLRYDRVSISLSGEYCVTRVAAGSNDEVQRELRQLENRSALYHTLGTGTKALGGSVRQIDPRHQHAMLTVVNQNTIDTLVEITKKLLIKIDLIEPTMISLCRLLGSANIDHDAPILLVCLEADGCELGISYQGQLLLNYQPAGIKHLHEIPEALSKHIARLHRYCERYARVDCGKIGGIYLTGNPDSVDSIQEHFASLVDLPVHVLDESQAPVFESELQLGKIDPQYLPAIGTMLSIRYPELPKGPNLIERIRSNHTTPLLHRTIRAIWPLAASVLITLFLWGAAYQRESEIEHLNNQLSELRVPILETQMAHKEFLREANIRDVHHEFNQTFVVLEKTNLFDAITQVAPENVWINDLAISNKEDLVIKGYGYTEDEVYQFLELLESLDHITHAEVESTLPNTGPNGTSTKFTMRCLLHYDSMEVKFNDDTI